MNILRSDKFRTLEFALVALALLYAVFGLNLQETAPGVQMTVYNLAVVCVRATLGYWIARSVLGRIVRADPNERDPAEFDRQKRAESSGSEYIARAIVVAAVILTSR
jgi:hypothetical protein